MDSALFAGRLVYDTSQVANDIGNGIVETIQDPGRLCHAIGVATGSVITGEMGEGLAPESPTITADELAGKTRTEIRSLAEEKGLEPAGDTTHPDYPLRGTDPVTGEDRIRLDRGHIDKDTGLPYDNPNAAVDHVHGYEPDCVTKVRHQGDAHIPTTGE